MRISGRETGIGTVHGVCVGFYGEGLPEPEAGAGGRRRDYGAGTTFGV